MRMDYAKADDAIFEGDNRWYFDQWGSARTTQAFTVDNPVDGGGSITAGGNPGVWVAETRAYEKHTSIDFNGITQAARDEWIRYPPMKTEWGRAFPNGECHSYKNGWVVDVYCNIEVHNGIYPFDPDIEYSMHTTLDFSGGYHVPYWISGCTKYYPAYEFWIDNQLTSASHMNIYGPWSLALYGCNYGSSGSGQINF